MPFPQLLSTTLGDATLNELREKAPHTYLYHLLNAIALNVKEGRPVLSAQPGRATAPYTAQGRITYPGGTIAAQTAKALGQLSFRCHYTRIGTNPDDDIMAIVAHNGHLSGGSPSLIDIFTDTSGKANPSVTLRGPDFDRLPGLISGALTIFASMPPGTQAP